MTASKQAHRRPLQTDLPVSAGDVLPHIRIQPSRGWISLQLRDLWGYRELLYFLTWRDIKVRNKQTVPGAAWAVLQPFFSLVVFSLFAGRLARVVESFRWALLDTDMTPGSLILVSALVAVGPLISGAYCFRRMENTFADVA